MTSLRDAWGQPWYLGEPGACTPLAHSVPGALNFGAGVHARGGCMVGRWGGMRKAALTGGSAFLWP